MSRQLPSLLPDVAVLHAGVAIVSLLLVVLLVTNIVLMLRQRRADLGAIAGPGLAPVPIAVLALCTPIWWALLEAVERVIRGIEGSAFSWALVLQVAFGPLGAVSWLIALALVIPPEVAVGPPTDRRSIFDSHNITFYYSA